MGRILVHLFVEGCLLLSCHFTVQSGGHPTSGWAPNRAQPEAIPGQTFGPFVPSPICSQYLLALRPEDAQSQGRAKDLGVEEDTGDPWAVGGCCL